MNSPNITNLCSQAAGTAELNCSLGLNSFNAVSCAQSILDVGQPWKDKNLFINTGNKTNPYTFLADACNNELSNSSEDLYPIANSGSTECVHIPNLDCALQFFGRAARTASQDGFKGLNQVVADRAELGLLVANEALVKAYETPFKQEVGIETIIVENFDKARNSTFQALEYIFNPYLLEMMKQTRPSTAAQINYRGLRRLAQLLAVDRTAADQKSGLLLRTRPSERSALLEEINKDGPALLVALVTLSIIDDAQGAPSTPEVEGLRIADMNGDGLSGLVHVRSGSLRFFPSRGFGYFDSEIGLPEAPSLTSTELKNLHIRDINGDGLSDMIVVGVR